MASPRFFSRGRPAALGLLLALVLLGIGLRAAPIARAELSGSKTCTSADGGDTVTLGGTANCVLTINASEPTDVEAGDVVTITPAANNFRFTSATCTASPGDCNVQVLPAAIVLTCLQAECTEITVNETLVITALAPETISQRVSVTSPISPITVTASGFRIVPPGNLFYVSTTGDDANNCQTRVTACRTINRALEVARDGDTIRVLSGTYDIDRPIPVRKLVTIEPENSGKVILVGRPGIRIFEIWAQGGPNLHVIIRNLTIGGNYKPGASDPVFQLTGDSYTEIANNIIGGEDLLINNGILISNSLHPNIHDNTFLGNTLAPFSPAPVLIVGRTVTGFGVASYECLL